MKIIPFHTIKLANAVDIYLMQGILNDLGEIVRPYINGNRALIVTDSNVSPLYGDKVKSQLELVGFDVAISEIIAGEESKNLTTVSDLYRQFNLMEIGRSDVIIALGGGVVGDIAGYAAATYMRGIPYIQVPTTLLAQIDSSIGGKTGVDLSYGKNLVGSFYQPKAIIIDTEVIKTLKEENFNDGIAEAIKYGLIRDRWIFDTLSRGYDQEELREVIKRSVLIKAEIVEEDEHEGGLRMILNYGHTYGHAIEKCMNYRGINHGAAVGVGMVIAASIGEQMGITPIGIKTEIINLLQKYNLPTTTNIDKKSLNYAIMSDKKRSGDKINFVLIKDIGQAVVTKITIKDLSEMNYE